MGSRISDLGYWATSLTIISSLLFCAGTWGEPLEKSIAFFIFGDSTVDTGNNNYINTIPENRADYKPYGRNGFFDQPTGRFCEGRIIVDFIGIKPTPMLIYTVFSKNRSLPAVPYWVSTCCFCWCS